MADNIWKFTITDSENVALQCHENGNWKTKLIFSKILKRGKNQGNAKAVKNEFWITEGHKDLPNNVVMIGT